MAGEAIPAVHEAIKLISLTPKNTLSLIGVGFMGGLLSGFIGSGGAFIMTPGMMGLGVPGIMAVGTNMAHKFGKAVVGARKHASMGNVDARLAISMFIALFAGTQTAVMLNKRIFDVFGTAGSNLYISLIYVIVLSFVCFSMARDIRSSSKPVKQNTGGPTLAQRVARLHIPPMIHFKVANCRVTLWLVLLVGFATGYLAGTIGVGGFIGVPAMIYLLGVPTMVAAGTELMMAIFSGAWGAFQYALNGFVDLRLVLLLYLGSLLGLYVGAITTKAVKEIQVKMVISVLVGIIAASRAVAIPVYLKDLHVLGISPGIRNSLLSGSNVIMYGSAAIGCLMILSWLVKALGRAAKLEEASLQRGA